MAATVFATLAVLLFREQGRAELSKELDRIQVRYDSLALEFRMLANLEASVRSDYEDMLTDLKQTDPELERRYREQLRQTELAQTREREATFQAFQAKLSKDEAKKEQYRAEQSEKQTKQALDSLAVSKREVERRMNQQEASLLAQNSMAITGDPALRGLMAVHAQRALEQAGGDVNSQETVEALSGALEVLQLNKAPGVQLDPVARTLIKETSGSVLAFDEKGHVNRVHVRGWTKEQVLDASSRVDHFTGRVHAVAEGSQLVLADKDGVRVVAVKDGIELTGARRSPHEDHVRAAARIGANGILATGDLKGVLAIWRADGEKLELLGSHEGSGRYRMMLVPAGNAGIVAVDGTSDLHRVAPDGTLSTIRIPGNEHGWTLAHYKPGQLLLGTKEGGVWSLDVAGGKLSSIRSADGQPVECLAYDEREQVIAAVNAVKMLTVQGKGTGAGNREFRMQLRHIPNAMVFGKEEKLYISSSDGVWPVFWSSRAMAARICELVGRTWTQQEWEQHVGVGMPEPTCSGF
ncbi:MAG: hypothetical protein KDB88_09870 [Flavobacteriales bacterium]|nr:hypothetical protein [Flavobacteriales bacterium]